MKRRLHGVYEQKIQHNLHRTSFIVSVGIGIPAGVFKGVNGMTRSLSIIFHLVISGGAGWVVECVALCMMSASGVVSLVLFGYFLGYRLWSGLVAIWQVHCCGQMELGPMSPF